MNSADEAYLYLSRIKQIVKYLGICDGNMEEGSLRCDANVSVRLKGSVQLGVKTEVKNMNSFRNVERAINFEIERQVALIEEGKDVVQETLLWDADLNQVFPMRSKEEAHDYRYFPEPDLFPVAVDEKWKKEIAARLPEMPELRKRRFTEVYKLPLYDADILTQEREIADYYEEVVSETSDYKAAINWVMGEVLKVLNEEKTGIKEFRLSAENLGKLINLINKGTISGKIAKEVFPMMLEQDKDPEIIVKEKNLVQISDSAEIENIIENIIQRSGKEVRQYREGKEKVFGYFVGQVMRESKGKANPKVVNDILKEKLEALRKG
jgi:aspartyl-tRNA(Asn)/glutamyl-tRNA(Gln) amidotransferase subunit B